MLTVTALTDGEYLLSSVALGRALHDEKLVGDRAGKHSIRLNDQWRLILRVETDEAGRILVIIAIVDYHP